MRARPDARLEVGILGDLVVRRAGEPVALGPRLQRALLALLAVDVGRVLPVDRLIELLWGHEPPPAATASLQAYISQLRRLLEPDRPARAPANVLRTREPGYVLELEDEAVDAERFRRLASVGRDALASGALSEALEDFGAALALWRGDPLAEFAAEPWAIPVFTRLVEEHETVLEDRVDAWLAQGRHAEVIGDLESMVAAEPFRERRWAQLMLALYRSGRQADALRAYSRCRHRLTDELGIEPGSELRRLEQAVLDHDPSLELATLTTRPSTGGVPTESQHAEVEHTSAAAPGRAPAHGLVAREVQLQRVAERLSELPDRGGAIVFVGEPGAGKTVLAEAAAEMARAAGTLIGWSRCVDSEGSPALWPWFELLRGLPPGQDVDAALALLRGERATADPDHGGPFAAYEAVLAALREATAGQPLVAVIDDLHAADVSSLKLLETISGDLHRLGALFILTLRDTEPVAHVGGVLGELVRHLGVEQLLVPDLDQTGVAELAEQFTGAEINEESAAALYERTGGNPFYVVELLRLLRSERHSALLDAADVTTLGVPSGVRDVIDRRLLRLPSDTRSLLAIAAAAGRRLDFDLLEHTGGIDTEQLMLGLEPAVAAGILVERADTWGYEFRHGLIEETICGGLGPLGRARLHARIANSIEELRDPSSGEALVALAYHQLAAGPFGDPAKAVDFSRRAARWSVRKSAWADAEGHLRQALLTTEHDRDTEPVQCEILIELGTALRHQGDIKAAHAALYRAIDIADQLGDEDRLLLAVAAFGEVALWGARAWGGPDARLIGLLDHQLKRADLEDVTRARLLATLSIELYHGQRDAECWSCAEEALNISRRLGDPHVYGMAAAAVLRAADGPDHQTERRALIDEIAAGAGPPVTSRVEAVVRAHRLALLLGAGDIAAFDAEFSRVHELTVKLRSRELQAQLIMSQACRELVLGRIAECLEVFNRSYTLLTELSVNWAQPTLFVAQLCVYQACGQFAANLDRFLSQLEQPEHPSLPQFAAPAAALAYVQLGDFDAARALADRTFSPPARVWTWILPMALWAQVAARVGSPDPGWLYDELLPFSGELALAGSAGVDAGGAVDSLLAGLAAFIGRRDEALRHAREGLALERRAGAKAWFARTSMLIAELEAD